MLFTEYYYLAYKNVHLKFSHTTTYRKGKVITVNPLLSPPEELIYFKPICGGGGGGSYLRGEGAYLI